MSYLSLYRKWRPGTFSDVIGQDHVTETLVGALREDRVAHAYVFSGPRGTGKTSTARILAKALNCQKGPTPEPCGECRSCVEIADGTSLDVYEMDAASHTSVDDVREIRERIPFATAGGGRKVYIIDEAHQLSSAAFNALLKMLEEPPPHVVFVLCTTESHKLPATVVSRCQRFEFRRHTEAAIGRQLATVAQAEGMTVDPEALALVARHAHGSMRDPLALLEQAAGSADGVISRDVVIEILGDAPAEALFALSGAVAAEDVAEAFRQVDAMVTRGWDPRSLLRQLLEHFRSLFLISNGAVELAEIPSDELARYREHAELFTSAHLDWVLRVLGEAQADVRASSHPRLALEVTLARAGCLQTHDAGSLAARIERLERALVSGAPVPAAPAASPAPDQAAAQTPAPVSAPPEQSGPTPTADHSVEAEIESSPSVAPETSDAPGAETPLDSLWDRVLSEVRAQSRVTYTHLQQGRPSELRDDALIVVFPGAFHAEQLSKRPEQLARVVTAIAKVFERQLRFIPEVGGVQEAPRDPGSEEGPSNGGPKSSPDELVRRSLGGDLVEEMDSGG